MTNAQWEKLTDRIMAGGVTVLTGAGVSTDSGLPDFRGRVGLWKDMDLATLLTAEGAHERFEEFTAFCKAALREVIDHQPNMSHRILAALQGADLIGLIVTQNVDGYHQAAGARNVLEIHGDIHRIVCIACERQAAPSDYLAAGGETCTCGGRRRPSFVLFGERLGGRFLLEGIEALAETKLLIAAGTQLEVAPVALAPGIVVRNGGAFAVINGEPIAQDDLAEFKLYGPIGETLRQLYDRVVERDRGRHGLVSSAELAARFRLGDPS